MRRLIKELWLMVTLIIAASLVLIVSDLGQRAGTKTRQQKYPLIAIMQISSTPLLDTHVAGVVDRLKERGMVAPDRSNLKLFNAQADFATANTISKEIIGSPVDIVITASTPALQIFSKANITAKKRHVFGAVTDPYGAGVGISGKKPDQHPPYMAGIGTFQPVKRAFTILREMNPAIKKVGVVRNAGEQCSEACMAEARIICGELGIELVDAVAGNTSEVSEAARSLVAKGVEAVWIGGDTVATASSGLIINIAKDAKIPVFTNDPSDAGSGALFGLGANYFTVGQYTADVAVSILKGKSPADFAIENVIPEQLKINREVMASLGGKYVLTPDIKKLLDDGAGVAEKRNRPALVAMINLVDNSSMDEAMKGVEAGLEDSGLRKGTDYILKKYCAQGEAGQLPQIFDAALMEKPDAVVTLTTPALIAAAKKVKGIPVIFTVASDPFKAGAFTEGNRPENFCGVHDDPPVAELLDMAQKHDPELTAVGIVYDASQINSVISVEKLKVEGDRKNIRVIEATASSVQDLDQAARSVIQRGAKALVISADNLANTGFPAIHKVARGADVPIYVDNLALIEQGATGGVGDDYRSWGRQSGVLTAKVLAGASPISLRISPTKDKRRIEPVTRQNTHAPWKLRMVLYSETKFAEDCRDGLMDGIKKAGLVQGKDYELKVFNAQGDMSTLSSIMTGIRADRPDLLMVISTPTLQAALRQAGNETRIVFTGVGDAVQAGAGKSETEHLPNVTGITTSSPFEAMAQLISETLPGVKTVGTLFTPAEINSEIYKNLFEKALEKKGIGLEAVPVASSSDVAQAAEELCRKDIQAVAQIADNLTRPGFGLISGKAAAKNMPVYVFDSGQMKEGGTVCLARDYYDAGIEAAQKALRILNGENPGNIPFNNTESEKLILNYEYAVKYGLTLSESLKARAKPFTIK